MCARKQDVRLSKGKCTNNLITYFNFMDFYITIYLLFELVSN